jgi:hypothetical protein
MGNQEGCTFRVLGKLGIAGTGFLVSKRHAVTCLHVIKYALGIGQNDDMIVKIGSQIECEFCLLKGKTVAHATVVQISPAEDAAFLSIDHDVVDSCPANLAPFAEKYVGHSVTVYGFPQTHPDGVNARGIIAGMQPNARFQIDFNSVGYKMTQGFSGAAVYTQDRSRVIGMISASDDTSALALGAGAGGMLDIISLTAIYNSEEYATPLRWLSGHLLPNLNVDLDSLEVRGLKPDECAQVRRALAMLYEHASLFAGGGNWDDELYQYMKEYFEIYKRWNSHKPGGVDAPRRRETLSELREHRRKYLKTGLMMRGMQADRIDVTICDHIFSTFDKAVREAHIKSQQKLFPLTAQALKEYKAYKRLRGPKL